MFHLLCPLLLCFFLLLLRGQQETLLEVLSTLPYILGDLKHRQFPWLPFQWGHDLKGRLCQPSPERQNSWRYKSQERKSFRRLGLLSGLRNIQGLAVIHYEADATPSQLDMERVSLSFQLFQSKLQIWCFDHISLRLQSPKVLSSLNS